VRILYIGDIMGDMGIQIVSDLLPDIKKDNQIDVVIAQAENVSNGKGITARDFQRLKDIGIDFCTGGNWSLFNDEITPFLENEDEPIIRPANYPFATKGRGYKYLKTSKGNILIISLLGQIVGRDAEKPMDNPLRVVDEILEKQSSKEKVTTIVNFHGDFSSEKKVIGYYLDGKVGAVIGDHWHIPTADAMILPKGTAHITDVGMCGSLDSSLGVELDVVIGRWQNGKPSRNILETKGRSQFNAVLVDVDEKSGLSKSITQIQIVR
jgi:metallophosphoesterase (TIGR00282 family)